jgi:hypothetical protein
MNKDILRQVLTVIATIAMITVNALANILPINGQQTGAISDRFEVYFTPAGYVFSIWGLIYVGLIAFTIFQALPSQRASDTLKAITPWYWLSSAANIAWIFLWHYNIFALTIVVMGVLLASLIMIYLRLSQRRADVTSATRLALHLPFSIYLGWITVATIANATALLWLAGWNGFGISAEVWTAIMLGVAVIVAAAMAFIHRDAAYLLVLVWAFAGIALKWPTVSLVSTSAWIAAGAVAALAVSSLIAQRSVLPRLARA